MEYTKGEWEVTVESVAGSASSGEYVIKSDHKYITKCLGVNARNNARLIAQAPRLYEALNKAQEDINWMLNNREFLNPEVFDYIDKAIAPVEKK